MRARHAVRVRDASGTVQSGRAIGAGGIREVYRARDPRLGRDVAIKVIS